MFLDGYENLVGIDGLDEVVGDLAAYSLVHDVFFLALGNHYHGCLRVLLLEELKRFQSRESRHVLVEDNEVERSGGCHVEGVAPVVCGSNVVSSVPQEQKVRFEKVDFVVCPEYALRICHIFFFPAKIQHCPHACNCLPQILINSDKLRNLQKHCLCSAQYGNTFSRISPVRAAE